MVEVVGLDVGDDGACGDEQQERSVALVGLGDEQSPAPSCALEPASLRSPPIANDGSNPQCWKRAASIEVVVVFPCVPATATPRRPAITDGERGGTGQHADAAPLAATSSRFDAAMAVETMTVSDRPVAHVGDVVPDTHPARRATRSAASTRDSFASLPETGRRGTA